MGGQLMEATVSYLMYNIPVARFASVSLDAISVAADFAGGVPVVMTADFEEVAGAPAGELYLLEGEMAELYVRARSLALMDGTNLSRMVRQREFLFSLLEVVKQRTRADITFPFRMYGELSPYLETDLTFHEMVFLGNLGLQNTDKIQLHLMEGEMVGDTYVVDEAFLAEYVLDLYYLPTGE